MRRWGSTAGMAGKGGTIGLEAEKAIREHFGNPPGRGGVYGLGTTERCARFGCA